MAYYEETGERFVLEYPKARYRKDMFKDKPWYGKYVSYLYNEPSAIVHRGSGRGYLAIDKTKLKGSKPVKVLYFDQMPRFGEIIYINGRKYKAIIYDYIPYVMKKGAIEINILIIAEENSK